MSRRDPSIDLHTISWKYQLVNVQNSTLFEACLELDDLMQTEYDASGVYRLQCPPSPEYGNLEDAIGDAQLRKLTDDTRDLKFQAKYSSSYKTNSSIVQFEFSNKYKVPQSRVFSHLGEIEVLTSDPDMASSLLADLDRQFAALFS